MKYAYDNQLCRPSIQNCTYIYSNEIQGALKELYWSGGGIFYFWT